MRPDLVIAGIALGASVLLQLLFLRWGRRDTAKHIALLEDQRLLMGNAWTDQCLKTTNRFRLWVFTVMPIFFIILLVVAFIYTVATS